MVSNWQGVAYNQAPDSANEIHGDKIAKQFGFKGGLVPGVTVAAYLMHPAVVTWGEEFLSYGHAHVRVDSPLYDEETFTVALSETADKAYRAQLLRPDGTVSANGEVSVSSVALPPPVRRGDRVADKDYVGPKATPEVFASLKESGCLAFRYHWAAKHRQETYLRDVSGMPDLLRREGGGYANMGYLLGCSNWILASNAHMNPWVHLETTSQNYSAVPAGTTIIAEMAVNETYAKKGHEFVDVDVVLFDEKDDRCLVAMTLRAIYRLRGF